MNAREWHSNASQVSLPSLLLVRKTSGCKGEGEWRGKVPSIQKMADVFFCLSYNLFTIMFSFSFVDKQNTYSCTSDLFANFSAVYIFPSTLSLNGNIP